MGDEALPKVGAIEIHPPPVPSAPSTLSEAFTLIVRAANPIDLTVKSIDLALIPIDLVAKSIDLGANPIDAATLPIDLAAKSIDFTTNPIDLTTK
jgi:hypothetical protein